MKTLFTSIGKITIFILIFSAANIISAQSPTYLLKVANESHPSPTTYEFEVFLLSTGATPFELQTLQFGLGWDTSILNGGTQSYSIVTVVDGNPLLPAPSELNASQIPTTIPAGMVVSANAAYPGVSYRYFNCAPKPPPGTGSGTIISSVDGGCTHPGTRVARFRITNSVPFRTNSTCKHIWSISTASNRTNTIIQAYPPGGGGAINITSAANNLNYNSPGSCITQPNGLVLNSGLACPSAIANGPYTTCANVVQLNGQVGGNATGGTWTSSTGGTFSPDANTLNAIYNLSAADITNGSVTLTLTTDNPVPSSCFAAISQATVSVISADDGNACTVDDCNSSNGILTITPIPGINDGNPATVDVCDPATGIITHTGPAYQLRIANESQPTPNAYEFDVFLLSTGTSPLELQSLQFGIGWDTTILNGGTQSYSIVTVVDGNPLLPAPSELNASQIPISPATGGTVSANAAYPGVSYRYFNCGPRPPPGFGFGTIISSVDGGCTHPGTRVARFRITNSVPFRTNSTCKHIWSISAGTNRLNTIIQAYNPATGSAFNITSSASNLNYDKPGSCIIQPYGLVLNSALTCPTAIANGPYTTCANVVQLNGYVGGIATGGTWTSTTGGTFSPDANTLNAVYNLSAADIANGSVTLTLTSDNPDPSSCTVAISQATVSVISADDGNACTVDYCNSSNGVLTLTPIPGIDDGNPATVDVCDPATGIITHTGPAYQLRVANESQPTPNTYEFDVFLLSTGSSPFELQTLQFGLGWDTTILNGGTQSYSIVTVVDGNPLLPAPSELNASQIPITIQPGGTVSTNAAYPGVSYRYFNCVSRPPPGFGNGTSISSVDGGCTHPGTRVARFRITNSVPFRTNSTCKHIWSISTGANRTNTIIQAYNPATGVTVNITSAANNLNYDIPGSCIIQPQGLILNPAVPICDTPPTANAGGSYASCNNNVQLNGSIGGSATGGTWTSATGGTFSPDANTLNAVYNLSAADIANGSVTLTLTSNNPDVACQPAVSSATITLYSIVDDNNPCTIDGCSPLTGPTHIPDQTFIPNDDNACTNDYCDASGFVHNEPRPEIDDNNACTDDFCDPLEGLIIHTLSSRVNDNDACTIDDCNTFSGIIIHIPNSPVATAVVSTPISCYGGSACVNVNATGGVTPYDISTVGTFCGYTAGSPPITFDVTDAAGCTVTTAPLLITQPAKVTVSASNVCSGGTGSATAVASGGSGTFTYLWSPGGLTTNPATGLSDGSYTVQVTDGNGCTATSFPVDVNCTVPCNAPGLISGPGGVCRGQSGVVYCIAPVPGALSYIWTLPIGATAVGSVTGNCITLNFNFTYNGGSLAVKTVCASGTSANGIPKNIPNIYNWPSTPGSISGNSSLCPGTCETYSVVAVSQATSYVWTATGGLTITSGQGTNTVTVCAPAGFTSGSLSVYAKNCRGNSGTRTKNINGNPSLPVWHNSGGHNITVGVCGGSTISYEVAVMPGVNVFVWSAPSGAIIYDRRGHSGNPLIVTGTDPVNHEWLVDVKFPAGFVSGNIIVYGQTACGNGPTATLAVRSKPTTPGTISGNSSVCKYFNNIRCYSIAAVTGATSYTWVASNGATIYSGQGSTNACVRFRYATSNSVTITVKANNSCGSSATVSKIVSVNSFCKTSADDTEIEVSENTVTSLSVYPNPTPGKARIEFTSVRDAKYSLKVVDVIGRVLISENIPAVEGYNEKEINLENVAKGLYLVSVQTEGGEVQTLRLVVE